MSISVSIVKGSYRNTPISGVFKVRKPYNPITGTIEVFNPLEGYTKGRVMVDEGDFTMVDADGEELGSHVTLNTEGAGTVTVGTDYEKAYSDSESEEEAMNRIEETFLMLDKITDACSRNVIRGLVVSGPPGIGKSFGVEKQLEAANMFRKLEGKDPLFEVVSGGVSPIGLYQKLYHNRSAKQVLVFDDCDGILFTEECLNLLKAALNSGDKRRICWNKESRVLAVDDIPESFDFEGSIIFLSNIDFERSIAKGSRISDHLAAIMSRCHYLDLEIGSTRDKLLRIKQIVRDGMLTPYDFSPQQEADVLNFVLDNSEYLREISLRMVKKIADFVKADPVEWFAMAEATVLVRDAKFRRLLEKKKFASKLGIELQTA